jgi:dTDP-4-dehydrorhamnose 3,5-epimerase
MIDGVVIRELTAHGDARGFFVETWRKEWFPDGFTPVQGNRANRGANSVTGLHYHLHQADWWYFAEGHARFVLYDLRDGSATKNEVVERDIEPGQHVGIYVPPGVAHGFSAITDITLSYLVDQYYNPADENGLAWDDPALGIDWGVTGEPIVTQRDSTNPRLADLPPIHPSR